LEPRKAYLRAVGQEIIDKFGLPWLQDVWNGLMKEFGPAHCQALRRTWEGVAQWEPEKDADALAAELIFIGKHNEFTVIQNDGSGRYGEDNCHKRARAIGELLNRVAGIEMMRYAWNQVKDAGLDAIDLELCWNGIGEWRR
jgi:hypothetical protein